MNYFKNIGTLEELKKEYRKLAKQYHPDLNKEDTTSIMQQINVQYEALFNQLKNASTDKHEQSENANTFKNIINELINYNSLTIDIVGSWLWVSGNTYQAKNTLKKLKFRWSKKRKMWYYFNDIEKTKRKRGRNVTYQQITSRYGIKRYKTDEQPLLTT